MSTDENANADVAQAIGNADAETDELNNEETGQEGEDGEEDLNEN